MNNLKSSILNLEFAINFILSSFFLSFLVIDSCVLNPGVITHVFNPILELAIPIGIPTK